MVLQPLLVALALGAGRGPAPAARPWAAYRAVAALDESARLLRGTVEIVIRNTGGGVLQGLGLRARSATVTRLHVYGGDLVAEAGGGWSIRRALGGDDSLVLVVDFTSPDAGPPDPPGTRPAGPDRRFDFHAWLPAVVEGAGAVPVVGTFLVRLDVPADQVVAGTGVPLCGDPGWTLAWRPPGRQVTLRGDAYPSPRDPAAGSVSAGDCRATAPGRKLLVWYAEDVRELALTLDPTFRYDEGDLLERPVRGLFAPGSERMWGAGSAVQRTETALAWLHEIFDSTSQWPWPQTTVVHGHPGSPGRVDPMLVAPDSNEREAIVRQVGRLYLASAIAVVPRDSAWLDEGLTRFQADLYAETQGRRWTYARLERQVLEEELAGEARPVLPGPGAAPGRDGARRAELLFHQLRWAAGDTAVRAILRAYWARARLGVAGESLFVAVVDSVTGGDLGRRFAAALREHEPVDYSIGATHVRSAEGLWRTTVEVRRRGSGQFPVEVRVVGAGDTAFARASGLGRSDTVVVVTVTRPRGVVLDPDGRSHDWDFLDNRKSLGLHLGSALDTEDRLGGYFSMPAPRDRLARVWAPVAWYNDAGGWTVGLRRRDDYLGRFDLNTFMLTLATGAGPPRAERQLGGRLLLRNPTALFVPGLGERLEAGYVEGRLLAGAGVTWSRSAHAADLAFRIVSARASSYLDTALYEPATTYELSASGSTRAERPGRGTTLDLSVTGGYAVRGAPAPDVRAREPYARLVARATGERTLGALHLRGRAWAGAVLARETVPRQRRVYFAGADPYELLDNPFLRSRGALLLRPGFHYHAPGGAGLRALDPTLGGRQAYALNLEVERDLLRRGDGLARRVAVAVFGDGALGDGDLDPAGEDRLRSAGDGGMGLRIDHRIGATTFQTRVDLPVWISVPTLAQDRSPGARRLGWRWTCSLAPAF